MEIKRFLSLKIIKYKEQSVRDKILTTSNYGICLFSVEVLQEFLKKEKVQTKKLLSFFQKDAKRFLTSQKDGIGISDIGSLQTFNAKEFCGNDISYQTLDGKTIYSDFKYDVPTGKYLLSIKGYARKQPLERPNSNYGYLFSSTKVEELL